MHRLLREFLREDDENENLYYLGIVLNNNEYRKKLEDEFNDYLFRTHLVSYIKKSIKYTSYKIKTKIKLLNKREKKILNVVDEEFQEERIYTIRDDSIDYIDIITKPSETVDFSNIIKDQKILKAIDMLTDRQKEILYKCIILGLDDKTVAKSLNISVQSVNKTKNAAIRNIRKLIGV
ncbi:helix-turn-helix transcriptional regulator [Caloranaerobacter azorensis]|nr:sigma factor-like helix-turn-helix DNA-binding protein [Caloranaerobacter azorensis]